MSASLIWETSSGTATLPDDASFNTLRTTKSTGDISSNLDKTVALVCDGHFSCAGTGWFNIIKANTKWQVSDWDAKLGKKKKRNVLAGIRKLNIWNYYYKGDTPDNTTIGVMAQELLPVFPELVHQPEKPGEYLSVNTDGISAVSLGGILELDESVTDVKKRVSKMERENELLRRDLRVQSDRLTEQDDRLRAQNDRMRNMEEMIRSQAETIRKQSLLVQKLMKCALINESGHL